MAPKKKKKDWLNSAGRKILFEDLRTGKIPLNYRQMSTAVAFQLHPEFAEHDGANKFAGRLSRARTNVKKKRETGAAEMALLAADRLVCPKPTAESPRWEGSAAEAFLKQDVANNKHELLTPKELYSKIGAAKVIKHVEQEVTLIQVDQCGNLWALLTHKSVTLLEDDVFILVISLTNELVALSWAVFFVAPARASKGSYLASGMAVSSEFLFGFIEPYSEREFEPLL